MTDFYQLDEAAQAQAMAGLAEAALPQWDLQGSELELIKYRENGVFRVTSPAGERYALRIHRHGYHSDAELRSELQWMVALEDDGIFVPTLVQTNAGTPFAVVSCGQVPEARQVDLFHWVDGEQLGSVEEGISDRDAVADNYHTIGALAARLHNQAVAWHTPEGFVRHAWDVDGLVGDEPFWGRFWELAALTDEQRALLLEARDRVRQGLTAYQADPENADRYSMIHADCVAENLMVEGDHVRLIDFDDAGYGWHLFELATALYFERGEDHFQDAFDALIEGYRQHRDLPDDQVGADAAVLCRPRLHLPRLGAHPLGNHHGEGTDPRAGGDGPGRG